MTTELSAELSQDETAEVRQSLLVGLPRTGKTSYLGLLFVAMLQGEDGEVVLEAFGQDYAYLHRIAQRLQGFEAAEHTEVGEGDGMNLSVRMPDGSSSTLVVPDLSGETWEVAHVERVIDEETADQMRDAAGFVVFTHVGNFRPNATVTEAKAAALDLGSSEDSWTAEAQPVEGPGVSPTQVALVDLIQIVGDQRPDAVRLSLVLSAFDAATGGDSPSTWVEKNLPLVTQFLETNASRIECKVFGVSAQGGSYATPEPAEGGAAAGAVVADRDLDLLERAYVLNGDGSLAKLHDPLLWALGDG